jgi:hypothetical protein
MTAKTRTIHQPGALEMAASRADRQRWMVAETSGMALATLTRRG